MAVDTKDKRICVANIAMRTRIGLTPTGSVTQNDKENAGWYYFSFTAPDPTVEGDMYKKSIDCTVGCKL